MTDFEVSDYAFVGDIYQVRHSDCMYFLPSKHPYNTAHSFRRRLKHENESLHHRHWQRFKI